MEKNGTFFGDNYSLIFQGNQTNPNQPTHPNQNLNQPWP